MGTNAFGLSTDLDRRWFFKVGLLSIGFSGIGLDVFFGYWMLVGFRKDIVAYRIKFAPE